MGSSVMSVTVNDVDRILNLSSESLAIEWIFLYVYDRISVSSHESAYTYTSIYMYFYLRVCE